VPELFGKGIVSTDAGMYGTVVFSPRGDEAFWVKDEHPGLFSSRLLHGRWTAPEEFPFRAGYRLNSPVFSADGQTLYFLAASRGPDGRDEDDRIWLVERNGDAWGEPRELDPRVNSVPKHFQFSVDEGGSVYFGGEGADLYVAERRNGSYLHPVRLPAPLNTTAPEMSPQIAPDGSFLLFDRFSDSPPRVRIMVSFRGPNGAWTEPRDLSPYTRSEGNDSGARISPDGRYLFFQSVREGSDPNRSVYWMEAGCLEDLRARAIASAGLAAPPAPPYLGEIPPDSTPKRFAPHVFIRELHSAPVFSPRGDVLFWNEMEGGTIQFMRGEDGAWSEPRVAPFNLPHSGEPSFSPDGGTLYFLSGHRTGESQSGFDENVWRVTLDEKGWSDPELLTGPVNDQPMHWGVSLAANGNLYFGQRDGSGDIWVSELRYGRYQDAVPLGPGANSSDMETTPEVAPDESFLVFARVVANGRGPVDLYVSFRDSDGAWMPAVPVPAVNTPEREISPRLSPDGKYLFFLRTVDEELRPFWVSAHVVTDLQPHRGESGPLGGPWRRGGH
jgi:Tol biopolymer transport system component